MHRLVSDCGWSVAGMFAISTTLLHLSGSRDSRAPDKEDLGVVISGVHNNNLKFADDIRLMAESEKDLQLLVTRTNTENHRFELTTSMAKTKV